MQGMCWLASRCSGEYSHELSRRPQKSTELYSALHMAMVVPSSGIIRGEI